MKNILVTLLFLMSVKVTADVGKQAYDLVNSGDVQKAIELLSKKEHKEKPEALFMMGMIYDSGRGVEKDIVKASNYYERAAKKGNAVAQFYIGMFYKDGVGVEKDSEKAIYWLRKASEHKNTRAMGMLAALLAAPEKGDLIEAYAWAHIAAKYDAVQAQTSARKVIEHYLTKEQIAEAKLLIKKIESNWN
ncbi:MAG: sel1 repeat family protein [Gammaproteobacteria bacterium]|nr:sel1 repeat family protein [Gammaproteobacteria bacterium]